MKTDSTNLRTRRRSGKPDPLRHLSDAELDAAIAEWLPEPGAPPVSLNLAAAVAEAREVIAGWTESTPLSSMQLDAHVIRHFLSRLVQREAAHRAAA